VTVSVVIPTHDRGTLLRRALDSVRDQTMAPAQIIVVDDGSTDDTADMVRREYPEVTLLEQAQAGVSAARNHGIGHSRNEWIAFLDSDDEWRRDKLERQCNAIAAHPEAVVCHTDEVWIRRGTRVNPMKKHAKRGGRIFEHCLPLCCISPSSVLLHRSVLDDVGCFDESLPACEDYDLWLRVCCRYPVLFVDEALVVKYGGHADQLSRRYWGMDRFRIRALEKIIAGDQLTSSQRAAACATLREKLLIYAAGAAKRGKHAEAERYQAKLRRLAGC